MAVVTNKALLCFWLLMLLALSSEEVRVSDAEFCVPIFHPFCRHDSDCDGPCEKETDPDAGYNNNRGQCRNLSCFCCPPAHHRHRHDDGHHGHSSTRKLAW